MSSMPQFQSDLDYLEDSLTQLEPYLLSRELFWPLGGNKPRLTVGGILISLKRIEALSQSNADQATVSPLTAKLELVRTRWRVAWEQKCTRELRTRLELWQNYLGDYRITPESYADDYRNEVRLRVLAGLLAGELPEVPEESRMKLDSLDVLLRGRLLPGTFVWDTDLISAFPQDEFWYLYGTLKK